jgi:hypothetical protein
MTMTNKNCFSRLLVGCTAVLVLSACGGGGGDGDGVTGPATITKEATLTIGQEVPAATAPTPPANPIGGTMTVTLTTATNAVSGTLTLTGDYPRVTAAHIHDGIIGTAGGVVIGLVDGGNGSWSLPAAASLTAAQAELFKAGGYYVNAHTALNPAGEIRGQLLGFADNIQPIFTANCAVSTCHVTPSSSGAPMSLAAGVSWGNLVNVGGRVIPGNSADSTLVVRIGGSTLQRMPPSPAPLLPATDQNLIKVWIDMGAKNN